MERGLDVYRNPCLYRKRGGPRLVVESVAGSRRPSAGSLRVLLLGLLASGVSGCMVGPDFIEPAAPVVSGYAASRQNASTVAAAASGGAAQRFRPDQDVAALWWRLFRSKQIDALIAEAIRNHPDLAAAQAALRQARETALAETGSLFPQVTTSDSLTRQRVSPAASGLTGNATTYTLYNVSVPVSYSPDLFGGTHRSIEADAAAAEYQRFELEATYLSLTANVITSAISDASYAAQIKVTQELIASQQKELDLLRGRFKLGAVGQADVLSQQSQVAQSLATLPPLQKSRAQNRDQLMAYLGRLPSEDHGEAVNLGTLNLPRDLPVTLPSKLVRQRPDIRASEEQLHEASAKIGVALANMLPSVTLSASGGSEALSASKLFGAQTSIYSLEASVSQTLFDGGTLYHKKEAQVAAFDEAVAKYRSTVVSAFQNVADELAAVRADAAALKADVEAERAAQQSLTISTAQFRGGSTSYTTVLNAEQTLLNASTTRVKAQAARFTDTAALFQSLGGGWWNRTDETGAASPKPTNATALSPLAAALSDADGPLSESSRHLAGPAKEIAP